jgi:hypothetical protein
MRSGFCQNKLVCFEIKKKYCTNIQDPYAIRVFLIVDEMHEVRVLPE